jgi:hypothetical protein
MDKLVITKVGGEPTGAPQPIQGYIPAPVPYPLQGGSQKPLKSILKKTKKAKIKGVKNPTSSRFKKHTIRVSTSKGHTRRVKMIKDRVKNMSNSDLRKLAEDNNFLINKNSPLSLRNLIEGGMIAGMIS